MEKPNPHIYIPPGYTVKKYIESRDWSISDLSQKSGIAPEQLEKIINNNGQISMKTAERFAGVFNTSTEFWMNLRREP